MRQTTSARKRYGKAADGDRFETRQRAKESGKRVVGDGTERQRDARQLEYAQRRQSLNHFAVWQLRTREEVDEESGERKTIKARNWFGVECERKCIKSKCGEVERETVCLARR